ncbi:MAG: hypothetical protein GY714_03120 [Desulfobacterales bacterium]|nr:hypothetical protein [Desulfobacterales bacterium]
MKKLSKNTKKDTRKELSFIDQIKILIPVKEVKMTPKKNNLRIITSGENQDGIIEYLQTFPEIAFQEEERDLFSDEVVLRYKILKGA